MKVYYKHIYTEHIGSLFKEYYVTGVGYYKQIRLNDGRLYYAPSIEFERL